MKAIQTHTMVSEEQLVEFDPTWFELEVRKYEGEKLVCVCIEMESVSLSREDAKLVASYLNKFADTGQLYDEDNTQN